MRLLAPAAEDDRAAAVGLEVEADEVAGAADGLEESFVRMRHGLAVKQLLTGQHGFRRKIGRREA
mgnify:CR=1 FL=1